MMSRALFSVCLAAALGCVALGWQQSPGQTQVPASALALIPEPKLNDTLRMVTNIGSFKIVRKGTELPSGRLEFAFQGSVLISELAPGSYLKVSGNVRKEYEDKAHGKQVYFGKGRILIVGKFRSCQWFGRNLDFTFKGSGVVRVVSEFDKNLNTGEFWFNSADKNPLQVALIPIVVPQEMIGPTPAITREEYEAQMKKLKGGG